VAASLLPMPCFPNFQPLLVIHLLGIGKTFGYWIFGFLDIRFLRVPTSICWVV
jgi:hypothetical protein